MWGDSRAGGMSRREEEVAFLLMPGPSLHSQVIPQQLSEVVSVGLPILEVRK